MSLSKDTLETEIRKVIDPAHSEFVGFSADSEASVRRADAAAKWATAFDNYGQSVQNVNSDNFLAPPNKVGFQAALSFTAGSAAGTAAEFGSAWSAYWTGLTFIIGLPGPINGSLECPNIGGNTIFGIIISSAVTAVVPAPLITALTALFGVASTDPAVKAADFANAFHTASVGNVAVLTAGTDTTPPPAGPLPITNTCRLF